MLERPRSDVRPGVRGGSAVRVLVGLAVVAALVATVVSAALRGQRTGYGTAEMSSFRADDPGLLAARLVLEQIGLPVESRRGAHLPDGTGHVLVRVLGPAQDALPIEERRADRDELVEWVARGNGALLLAQPGDEELDVPGWPRVVVATAVDDGPEVEDGDEEDELAIAATTTGEWITESVLVDGLRDPWIGTRHALEGAEDLERLADRDDDPVVARVEHGNGSVIVVADPFFAANVRLAKADNAAWLAHMVVSQRRGGTVWIDDRAVGQAASRGLLSLLVEGGLGPTLLLALGTVLLFWWRNGPSDVPALEDGAAGEYRPESVAELRAGLYVDSLSAGDVRRVVRDETARRLARGEPRPLPQTIELLETRRPEAAEALRDALAAVPTDKRIDMRDHKDTWVAAVATVWRALSASTTTAGTEDTDGND